MFHYSMFGLKNSGATFQRMMYYILSQLPHCLIYVDDLFSDNNMEHELHLVEVLPLLRMNGLIACPDKCTFAAPTVNLLGHRISSDVIRPRQSKSKVIQDYPMPTTITELQTFICMVNYYYNMMCM